jgi:hypothetical protein
MEELPDIHEIGKLKLGPGDILVVRNTEMEIDSRQAVEVKRHVLATLGLPDNFPLLVLGRDWEVVVGTPEYAGGEGGST